MFSTLTIPSLIKLRNLKGELLDIHIKMDKNGSNIFIGGKILHLDFFAHYMIEYIFDNRILLILLLTNTYVLIISL